MKRNDIPSIRRAIALLAPTKRDRRYPPKLRARLIALVREHPEQSIGSLARALDMAPQTLERIAAGAHTSLVPVQIVERRDARSALIVRGPRGIVVEGLDVDRLADLIRALS